MNFEYVQHNYGVPACYGRRVIMNGKAGIIVADLGHHVGVNFDDDKPGDVSRCHPTWEMVYGEIVVPRPLPKLTASQKRYQEFKDAQDWFGDSFADWLGIKPKKKYL